jgi:hypothetical protein
MKHLSKHFNIVNKQTRLGLLDVLMKLPKCDVLYFNWIEDLADKKFGLLQVVLLPFILIFSKIANIKVVWFVHNNLSHRKKNRWLKEKVVALMKQHADVVLSHSAEARIEGLKKPVSVFHHPVAPYNPVVPKTPFTHDLLIWGSVNPYKGVGEFLQFNRNALFLQAYKISIVGKFATQDYYKALVQLATPNVTLENKILNDEELAELLSASRYVLFTYNSASILSSAALCKTLSYGKTIIGPAKGAFKELGSQGFIYNYETFEDLVPLLKRLDREEAHAANEFRLQEYIRDHSWPAFAAFVARKVSGEESLRYTEALTQS